MLGEGVTLATDGYAVTGADGVGMELTFLGNVVAGTYAVYHSNSHSVDLTVGAAGSLTAYAHSTVRLSASNGVNLANHGTITSQTQRGVMLTDTDGEMTVLFNNTGLISTLSTYYAAVDLSAGTGLIRFDNSGTIQGA